MTIEPITREDLPFDDIIVLTEDWLDSALLGTDQDGKAVYDYDLLVEAFTKNNEDWTEEDAMEWIDYNVIGTHMVTILFRPYQ